jgi:hypothetical protein
MEKLPLRMPSDFHSWGDVRYSSFAANGNAATPCPGQGMMDKLNLALARRLSVTVAIDPQIACDGEKH